MDNHLLNIYRPQIFPWSWSKPSSARPGNYLTIVVLCGIQTFISNFEKKIYNSSTIPKIQLPYHQLQLCCGRESKSVNSDSGAILFTQSVLISNQISTQLQSNLGPHRATIISDQTESGNYLQTIVEENEMEPPKTQSKPLCRIIPFWMLKIYVIQFPI